MTMTHSKDKTKQAVGSKSDLGFTVDKDGIDHINIHPMAKTELGRLLSHYVHTPFTHPYFGPFYSMEGFWYFARNGFSDSRLRYLSGYRAKQVGQEVKKYKSYDDFKQDIVAANYQKIIQHDNIRELVIASELPFDQYYINRLSGFHITPRSAEWLVAGFEEIRRALKEGIVPSVWLEAEKRYLKK